MRREKWRGRVWGIISGLGITIKIRNWKPEIAKYSL
jgi:hypothetical protein